MDFLASQFSNLFKQQPDSRKQENKSSSTRSSGSRSGQETIIELQRGTLSYLKPTEANGHVQENQIYKSASLSIIKDSSPFKFHLLVTRILGKYRTVPSFFPPQP
jgi:hypothetical protein